MNNTWIYSNSHARTWHVLCMCVIHMSACIILFLHLCCYISKMKQSQLAIGGAEACASDVRAAGASSGTECRSELSLVFYSGFLVLQSRQFQQFQQGRWESLYPSGRPPELDSRDSYPAPWPHKFARSEALRTGHHVLHRECRFDRAYSRFEVMSTWLVGGDYLKWLIL